MTIDLFKTYRYFNSAMNMEKLNYNWNIKLYLQKLSFKQSVGINCVNLESKHILKNCVS